MVPHVSRVLAVAQSCKKKDSTANEKITKIFLYAKWASEDERNAIQVKRDASNHSMLEVKNTVTEHEKVLHSHDNAAHTLGEQAETTYARPRYDAPPTRSFKF